MIYFFILFFEKISLSSIVVLPFEVNQINFSNKKYSPTELINLLFKKELYTPIRLGSQREEYFGIISFDEHHPILSEFNCEKTKIFQRNQNIIKKGYIVSKSKTSKHLGDIKNYLNQMPFGEIYSEEFLYFNTTLKEQNINNNSEITEIVFIKDNLTNSNNPEMCLVIGIGEPVKIYNNPSLQHIIDHLYSKRKLKTSDWTIKFTDQNSGLLIIGNLPHEYENNTIKYYEKNYTKTNTENIARFFRPWAISMKEIYFYIKENEKIIVNKDENRLTLAHNFGFIVGSNKYKEFIYKYYFNDLIDKNICEIQSSEKTIYNKSIFIDTDGNYSMFICDKEKINYNNYIKNFPILHLSHIEYNYTFELTYKDLFLDIYNYYYFMIIFPNNQTDTKYKIEEWYMGLPFLKKYQFILNFDSHTIGFYRTKNFEEEEKKWDEQNTENDRGSKIWIYILQIVIVIILVGVAFYIGMILKKQRKKRANELKDDYEYIEDNKLYN